MILDLLIVVIPLIPGIIIFYWFTIIYFKVIMLKFIKNKNHFYLTTVTLPLYTFLIPLTKVTSAIHE